MSENKNAEQLEKRAQNIWKWLIGSEFVIAIAVLALAAAGYIALK